MSIASQHPTAVRRLRAGVLAAVAALAALATVLLVLTWQWVAAAVALVVLLTTTARFWRVVERTTA